MMRPAAIVKTKEGSSPVFVGEGLLEALPRLMDIRCGGSRCVLVTDARLEPGLGRRVRRILGRGGRRADLFVLPVGERAKSPAALQKLYGFLLRSRVERGTPLVALGGGTVGDAAGFAAATFYRGIPLVQVPTTLLAQVDSAIGGKTAVNHPLAKNAVGAFHQPVFAAADPSVLRTLSERDFHSGLGEVVKYGLALDAGFARLLRRDWALLTARDAAALARAVGRCARIKARIVSADERDLSGTRELLNFGHTVGHSLEIATRYRLRHGEAVALGMGAAVLLSQMRGIFDPQDVDAASWLLDQVCPPWPRGAGLRELEGPIGLDKKVRGSKNVFILLRGLGRPVRVSDVSVSELRLAIDGCRLISR